MWFIRAMGEFENGVQIPILADLGENYAFGTTFFHFFGTAPVFNTYDLLLSKDKTLLGDILNVISEEEKETNFTTA